MAIAVNDLDAAIAYYAETFGATVAHRERIESDGVEEALLKVADSYIQLLTPIRDDSPVARYLEKKGEGLHHVGYRVADCAEALQSVKDHGGRVIDEAPRPGIAGDHRGLHPSEGCVRHAHRARAGVAPLDGHGQAAPAGHPRPSLGRRRCRTIGVPSIPAQRRTGARPHPRSRPCRSPGRPPVPVRRRPVRPAGTAPSTPVRRSVDRTGDPAPDAGFRPRGGRPSWRPTSTCWSTPGPAGPSTSAGGGTTVASATWPRPGSAERPGRPSGKYPDARAHPRDRVRPAARCASTSSATG